MQRRGGESAGGFDLKDGVIFGVGAWILGIVLTGVLAWVEFRDTAQVMDQLGGSGDFGQFGGAAESLPSALDFVGWLFYNVHFVDVGLSLMGQGIWFNFVTASVDLTGQMSQLTGGGQTAQVEQGLELLISTVPTPVWLLVPVVALVAAGYAVASRSGAADTTQGAKAGASVAIGYFALAVGGTFLFTWSVSGGQLGMSLSIAPQLMMSAGLMGLVYPAVFGGVGGAIAARTADRPTPRQAAPAPGTAQGQPGYQQPGQQPPQGQQAPAGQRGQEPPRGQQGSFQQDQQPPANQGGQPPADQQSPSDQQPPAGQRPPAGQGSQQSPTPGRESQPGRQRDRPAGGREGDRPPRGERSGPGAGDDRTGDDGVQGQGSDDAVGGHGSDDERDGDERDGDGRDGDEQL